MPILASGLLILACTCGGCLVPCPVPGSVVLAPATYGRVADSRTGMPVAGARVTVDYRPETTTCTGEDGSFYIAELRKKYLIVFMEPGGERGHIPPVGDVAWVIRITHSGYEDFENQIVSQEDYQRSDNDLKVHILKPVLLTPAR